MADTAKRPGATWCTSLPQSDRETSTGLASYRVHNHSSAYPRAPASGSPLEVPQHRARTRPTPPGGITLTGPHDRNQAPIAGRKAIRPESPRFLPPPLGPGRRLSPAGVSGTLLPPRSQAPAWELPFAETLLPGTADGRDAWSGNGELGTRGGAFRSWSFGTSKLSGRPCWEGLETIPT